MAALVPDYGEPKKRRRHRKISEADLAQFVKDYGRKAQSGREPNDRSFSREIAKKLKRMRPEDIDRLMRGGD